MKIRMLTLAAGPDGVLQAGKIAEVPEAKARALIAGGYAVDLTPCPFPNPLQGAEAAREGKKPPQVIDFCPGLCHTNPAGEKPAWLSYLLERRRWCR